MAPVLVSRPVLTLADGVADQRCNRVVLLCLQPPPSSAAATLPSHSTCCAPSTCGATPAHVRLPPCAYWPLHGAHWACGEERARWRRGVIADRASATYAPP